MGLIGRVRVSGWVLEISRGCLNWRHSSLADCLPLISFFHRSVLGVWGGCRRLILGHRRLNWETSHQLPFPANKGRLGYVCIVGPNGSLWRDSFACLPCLFYVIFFCLRLQHSPQPDCIWICIQNLNQTPLEYAMKAEHCSELQRGFDRGKLVCSNEHIYLLSCNPLVQGSSNNRETWLFSLQIELKCQWFRN
jgi:hypothetical protein